MKMINLFLATACLAVGFFILAEVVICLRRYLLRGKTGDERINSKYLYPLKRYTDFNIQCLETIAREMKESKDGTCEPLRLELEALDQAEGDWFSRSGYFFASSCYYAGGLFACIVDLEKNIHMLNFRKKDMLSLQDNLRKIQMSFAGDHGIYEAIQSGFGTAMLEADGIISYRSFCGMITERENRLWFWRILSFYQSMGSGKRLDQIGDIRRSLVSLSHCLGKLMGEESLLPGGNGKKTAHMKIGRILLSQYRLWHKRAGNRDKIMMRVDELGDSGSDSGSVDTDWLDYFMERTGIVSDEQMQILLAKLMSAEKESPGTISKTLIDAACTMGKNQSRSFLQLCRHGAFGEKGPAVFIDYLSFTEYFQSQNLSLDELLDLERLGLIHFNAMESFRLPQQSVSIYLNGEPVTVKSREKEQLKIGNVILTGDGKQLFRISGTSTVSNLLEVTKELWGDCDVIKEETHRKNE